MVYMRGHPLDYDSWENDLKLKKWSYKYCLPYFKNGETVVMRLTDIKYLGGGGG